MVLVLCQPMPATKKTDRIYLREEETTILQSLLQEWSDKPDKKSKDAFVSGTAVPKIQAMNNKDYGPEVTGTGTGARHGTCQAVVITGGSGIQQAVVGLGSGGWHRGL